MIIRGIKLQEPCSTWLFLYRMWTTPFIVQYSMVLQAKFPPQDVDLPALPQELKVHNAFVYGPDGEVLEFFRLRNNASASDRITEEMNS